VFFIVFQLPADDGIQVEPEAAFLQCGTVLIGYAPHLLPKSIYSLVKLGKLFCFQQFVKINDSLIPPSASRWS
jgi:hypothetical protein